LHCFFAASCARQMVMAASRNKCGCWSRCSTVSLSSSPSIIWSLVFFRIHWLIQKLQVFVNSLRATKKSSKVSPGCCVQLCRFRHSTDSLIWQTMCRLSVLIMASTSFLCSSDKPRLLTIARVSLNKHKVSTCTCGSFTGQSYSKNIHYAIHASKSAPRYTWISSLGRSNCLKTFSISLGFS